ncbi:MAG: hypothetical protein RL591_117, partial [Planctomycetota bacterium]
MQLIHGGLAFGVPSGVPSSVPSSVPSGVPSGVPSPRFAASRVAGPCALGSRGRAMAAAATLAGAIGAAGAGLVAGDARADGTVVCWGVNDYGQCNVPADLGSVKALGRGSYNPSTTFVIGSGLQLRGWGYSQGCPIASFPRASGPLAGVAVANNWIDYHRVDLSAGSRCGSLPASESVVELATQYAFTLARLSDGSLRFGGNNNEGVGNIPSNAAPSRAIAAGDSMGMSLRADGTVVCWGRNFEGQCVVPADLATTSAIAAGVYHAMALDVHGAVRCWGYNAQGQCSVPTDLPTIVAIAAGGYHSVALTQEGTVRCWGDNGSGQCNVPADLGSVKALGRGSYNYPTTFVIGSGLQLRGWGDSQGCPI